MSKRGDPIVLWDSLAALPLATDLIDITDGVPNIPTQNGISIVARGGMIEVWRDDPLDTHLTHATGTLTLTGNPSDGQTCTIDSKVYTFQDTLTNVDGHVQIGVDAAATIVNLVAAIMLGAGAGTQYATSTTAHPTVMAVGGAGTTVVVTAVTGGTGGNSIATTETMSNATWGGATLAGGASEVDATITVDAPVTLYGWNGSVWVADDVLAAADFVVGRQRGTEYEVANAGLYEYLALVATGATVSDSGTIRAVYYPIAD